MPDTPTIAQREALYGKPVEAATVKDVDRITPLSHARVGDERYDREWPERAQQTMW